MADTKDNAKTENTAEKLDEKARKDAAAAAEAQKAADEGKLSDVERAALEAKRRADDSAAKAAEARALADAERTKDPTRAVETKNPAVITGRDEGGLLASDHKAQKFANDPANPAPAPGLKPVEDEGKERLEITDSDNPDPANPKVAYVHPDMVGDYLRAGWRRPA